MNLLLAVLGGGSYTARTEPADFFGDVESHREGPDEATVDRAEVFGLSCGEGCGGRVDMEEAWERRSESGVNVLHTGGCK